jgi:outer membrane protein assembly factor BamB
MKWLISILVSILLVGCSFDDKTGIWNDASNIPVEISRSDTINKKKVNSRFEDVFIDKKIFNEEKELDKNFNFKIENALDNTNWPQEFASNTNNVSNFKYNDNKLLISKSSKLSKTLGSKYSLIKNTVLYNKKIISYDHKGSIFVYSFENKKKILEFNFYKKAFKEYNKKIFLVVNENKIYAADNLGYVYAIDIETRTLIWAKNYGIPFRSNIKFFDGQLFLANQDNIVYSIKAKNGEKNWQLSSSVTFLKSEFKNNIVIDELNNNIIFINTSGELYSLNYLNQRINWVLNFKNFSLKGDTDLFLSQPLAIKDGNLFVSTENSLLSYNLITGSRNWIKPVAPILKPIITKNNVFTFTKNDLLICIDRKTGDIRWSKNIYLSIKKPKKMRKIGEIFNLSIANDNINLFSHEGYLLSFDFRDGTSNFFGKISKHGISSVPIFSKGNMFLTDGKNKVLKFN